QVLFTIDLAQELAGKNVTANSLHPSTFMNTTMVRQMGREPISTVDQGADAVMRLIASDDVAGQSGLFFNVQQESRADPLAYDAEARRKLRALSDRLTGLA